MRSRTSLLAWFRSSERIEKILRSLENINWLCLLDSRTLLTHCLSSAMTDLCKCDLKMMERRKKKGNEGSVKDGVVDRG